MPLAKLSSKSQIVLPAAIRRRLGIHPGDEMEISTENDAIIIRKAVASATESLDSCGSDIWQGYEKEIDQARDQWN